LGVMTWSILTMKKASSNRDCPLH